MSTPCVIRINQVERIKGSGELVCHGLGSCVAVFFYAKTSKVGAGAHILLPTDPSGKKSRLIERAYSAVLPFINSLEDISTFLIGGANIFPIPSIDVGNRNILFAKEVLKDLGISQWYEHTGGDKARSAKLDLDSGQMEIRVRNENIIKI